MGIELHITWADRFNSATEGGDGNRALGVGFVQREDNLEICFDTCIAVDEGWRFRGGGFVVHVFGCRRPEEEEQ